MLSRAGTRNNGRVPELPDLRVLSEAFTAALAGRVLRSGRVIEPLVLRGTGADMRRLEGGHLQRVRQRGKFLLLDLEAGGIVINAMLTGRLGIAAPGSRAFPSTALVLTFGPREAALEPEALAPWTLGAPWLPPDDQRVELRYRDPRRMGKVYLLPTGVQREVAGWADLGPDVDDPKLDLDVWEARIRRHHGELHTLLKDQAFVAGIGNAYSDEVLWAARLAPFRRRTSLAREESGALWRASRETMAWAISEVRRRVPPRFEVQARDFLKVHLRGGQPCPRCGAALAQVSPGGFVTTWCRACQASA
jgi:formamidopyrimidine-DNA glycosylase